MKIGMTGTRDGMTDAQRLAFNNLLADFIAESDPEAVFELHHGDCIGADADAHDLAELLAFDTHVHPPEKDEVRAFKDGTVMYAVKSYFARNRDIVNATDILVGFPVICKETPRGGTWYTINYADKNKRPYIVIWPDGSMSRDHKEHIDT